jgi:hypothetical protein
MHDAMNIYDNPGDPVLESLMKKLPMEQPSGDFTQKVMDRIRHEEQPVHIGIFSHWQDYYLYAGGIVAAAAIFILFWFNWGQGNMLNGSLMSDPGEAEKVLMGFRDGFSSLFAFFERIFNSSILVVVMGCLAILYLTDRIIRYFSPSKGHLLTL